jgi:hypothetical protein
MHNLKAAKSVRWYWKEMLAGVVICGVVTFCIVTTPVSSQERLILLTIALVAARFLFRGNRRPS